MDRNYGTVEFEGKEYTLTQDAYAENYGTDGEVRYYANAIDTEGKKYIVAWETTKDFNRSQELYRLEEELKILTNQKIYDDGEIARMAQLEEIIEKMENEGISSSYCEDESNACDWETPINVKEV